MRRRRCDHERSFFKHDWRSMVPALFLHFRGLVARIVVDLITGPRFDLRMLWMRHKHNESLRRRGDLTVWTSDEELEGLIIHLPEEQG